MTKKRKLSKDHQFIGYRLDNHFSSDLHPSQYIYFDRDEWYNEGYGSDSGFFSESGYLEKVKGSRAIERRESTSKWYRFNQQELKFLQTANERTRHSLYDNPARFFIKLSQNTAKYPASTIEISVDWGKIEGKKLANRLLCILIHLATQPETKEGNWWMHEYIIEDILRKWLLDPFLNTEGSWADLAELISVFADKKSRSAFLKTRFTSNAYHSMKANGKRYSKNVFLTFIPSKEVKELQRKPGYSDSGNKQRNHEKHGEKPTGEVKNWYFREFVYEEKYLENDLKDQDFLRKEVRDIMVKHDKSVDTQELLTEIYKSSRANYLLWLEQYSLKLKLKVQELEELIAENDLQLQKYKEL